MKHTKHYRHHHFWVSEGELYECFMKSRGDLSSNFIMKVDLPDSDKLTDEQIKEIFDGAEET